MFGRRKWSHEVSTCFHRVTQKYDKICLQNVNNSMQFPYPRDKKGGAAYAVWQQNEHVNPVDPTICHGLDTDATVRTGATLYSFYKNIQKNHKETNINEIKRKYICCWRYNYNQYVWRWTTWR